MSVSVSNCHRFIRTSVCHTHIYWLANMSSSSLSRMKSMKSSHVIASSTGGRLDSISEFWIKHLNSLPNKITHQSTWLARCCRCCQITSERNFFPTINSTSDSLFGHIIEWICSSSNNSFRGKLNHCVAMYWRDTDTAHPSLSGETIEERLLNTQLKFGICQRSTSSATFFFVFSLLSSVFRRDTRNYIRRAHKHSNPTRIRTVLISEKRIRKRGVCSSLSVQHTCAAYTLYLHRDWVQMTSHLLLSWVAHLFLHKYFNDPNHRTTGRPHHPFMHKMSEWAANERTEKINKRKFPRQSI